MFKKLIILFLVSSLLLSGCSSPEAPGESEEPLFPAEETPIQTEPVTPEQEASPEHVSAPEPAWTLESTDAFEVVVQPKYDYVRSFSDGLAAVELDGKWGFIDKTGEEVIPLEYSFVMPFSEGVAWVTSSNQRHNPWGLIDKEGNEVLPHEYYNPSPFSEGLAIVDAGDVSHYVPIAIDITGETIISGYELMFDFREGLAAVGLRSEEHHGMSTRFSYVDKTGREIVEFSSPIVYFHFQDGLRIDFTEGLAAYNKDGKYGFINQDGDMVIPNNYIIVQGFSEGLSAFRSGDWDAEAEAWIDGYKVGYINQAGQETIIFSTSIHEWVGLGNFSNGLASVIKDNKVGYIDKDGNTVIPFIYAPEHGHGDYTYDFSEGLVVAKKGDYENGFKYGFINTSGDEAVPFIFDNAESVSEGMAAVCIGGYWENDDTYIPQKWGFIRIN